MKIADIIGLTFRSVKDLHGDIIFTDTNNNRYKMYHDQLCCESVDLKDINGNLTDLENSPVLEAYEETNDTNEGRWTFYRFITNKGTVVFRWYGDDNYYSVSVDFKKMTN